MNKAIFKSLWMMVWSTATMFVMMTKTKADDNVVSAIGTEAMSEEFWAFLVQKGWVKGTQVAVVPLRSDLGLAEEKVA